MYLKNNENSVGIIPAKSWLANKDD